MAITSRGTTRNRITGSGSLNSSRTVWRATTRVRLSDTLNANRSPRPPHVSSRGLVRADGDAVTRRRVTRALVWGTVLVAAAPAPAEEPAPSWQDYVPAPRTATPQPVRVARVIGDVSNASALAA